MGQDKALVPFLGKPLVQNVIQRLAGIADELLVTTNRLEAYRFLGVPLAADLVPGRGALGGLYTALQTAGQPLAAVVACDMPFASPRLLAAQRDILLEDPDLGAVIPCNSGGMEPFHTVFRRSICLPIVKAALDAGQWRADCWYSQVKLRLLEAEEVRRIEPDPLVFWNLNTPDDVRQAEQVVRSQREENIS